MKYFFLALILFSTALHAGPHYLEQLATAESALRQANELLTPTEWEEKLRELRAKKDALEAQVPFDAPRETWEQIEYYRLEITRVKAIAPVKGSEKRDAIRAAEAQLASAKRLEQIALAESVLEKAKRTPTPDEFQAKLSTLRDQLATLEYQRDHAARFDEGVHHRIRSLQDEIEQVKADGWLYPRQKQTLIERSEASLRQLTAEGLTRVARIQAAQRNLAEAENLLTEKDRSQLIAVNRRWINALKTLRPENGDAQNVARTIQRYEADNALLEKAEVVSHQKKSGAIRKAKEDLAFAQTGSRECRFGDVGKKG